MKMYSWMASKFERRWSQNNDKLIKTCNFRVAQVFQWN